MIRGSAESKHPAAQAQGFDMCSNACSTLHTYCISIGAGHGDSFRGLRRAAHRLARYRRGISRLQCSPAPPPAPSFPWPVFPLSGLAGLGALSGFPLSSPLSGPGLCRAEPAAALATHHASASARQRSDDRQMRRTAGRCRRISAGQLRCIRQDQGGSRTRAKAAGR